MDRRNSHLLLLLQAKSQRSNRKKNLSKYLYWGQDLTKEAIRALFENGNLVGTTRQLGKDYRLTHIVCNFNKIGILLNDRFSFVVCLRFKCFLFVLIPFCAVELILCHNLMDMNFPPPSKFIVLHSMGKFTSRVSTNKNIQNGKFTTEAVFSFVLDWSSRGRSVLKHAINSSIFRMTKIVSSLALACCALSL